MRLKFWIPAPTNRLFWAKAPLKQDISTLATKNLDAVVELFAWLFFLLIHLKDN
jgi:hypothetical protein